MKRVIEQSIPNEFSPSLIYYHIDHNENLSNGYYNPAELTAMREERLRLEEEQKKQILFEENLQKYRNNIKKYNQTHIQDSVNETTTSISSIQRGKEYNENLRKQMKIKNEKKNQKKLKNNDNNENKKQLNNNFIPINESKQFTQGSEVMNTFSFKNNMNSLTTEENSNNINYENIKNNNNNNNNVRDISGNILEQIIEQNSLYNNISNDNSINTNSMNNLNNIQEKINQNIEMVKNFRQNGLSSLFNDNKNLNNNDNFSHIIKQSDINDSISTSFNPSQYPNYPNNSFITSFNSNKNFYNNSNMTELQQKRYQKALKKMMIEQLKNNQINIPSICSCGQLQRKIDALLNENREITPDDLMNVDCANNCIYYQKPGEYHKALSNIIQGIRNLKMKNNKK
jgi:hypothetical protein